MPPTEQREVRERGRATMRPVTEMMPLGEADAAAREAAAPVPMVEGSRQGGGNRPVRAPISSRRPLSLWRITRSQVAPFPVTAELDLREFQRLGDAIDVMAALADTGVEFADQSKQARGGGVEMRGQQGDLVAVAGAPGGSWGVPRPSVADCVTGTRAGTGRPPPEGANVVYALVPPAQLSGGSSSEGVPSPRGRAKPMTGGDFNSRRARGIPRAPRPRLGAGRR
jgi:hypothetical protein